MDFHCGKCCSPNSSSEGKNQRTGPKDQRRKDIYRKKKINLRRVFRGHSPFVWLLGPPGTGKRTQGVEISKTFEYVHISVPDLVIEESRVDSVRGEQVSLLLESKTKFPEDVALTLLKEALTEVSESTPKPPAWLVSGYPRLLREAYRFEREIGRCGLIIYLWADSALLSGRIFKKNSLSNAPTPPNLVHYLDKYHERIVPLLQTYSNRLEIIDASKPTENVFSSIKTVIKRFQKNLPKHNSRTYETQWLNFKERAKLGEEFRSKVPSFMPIPVTSTNTEEDIPHWWKVESSMSQVNVADKPSIPTTGEVILPVEDKVETKQEYSISSDSTSPPIASLENTNTEKSTKIKSRPYTAQEKTNDSVNVENKYQKSAVSNTTIKTTGKPRANQLPRQRNAAKKNSTRPVRRKNSLPQSLNKPTKSPSTSSDGKSSMSMTAKVVNLKFADRSNVKPWNNNRQEKPPAIMSALTPSITIQYQPIAPELPTIPVSSGKSLEIETRPKALQLQESKPKSRSFSSEKETRTKVVQSTKINSNEQNAKSKQSISSGISAKTGLSKILQDAVYQEIFSKLSTPLKRSSKSENKLKNSVGSTKSAGKKEQSRVLDSNSKNTGKGNSSVSENSTPEKSSLMFNVELTTKGDPDVTKISSEQKSPVTINKKKKHTGNNKTLTNDLSSSQTSSPLIKSTPVIESAVGIKQIDKNANDRAKSSVKIQKTGEEKTSVGNKKSDKVDCSTKVKSLEVVEPRSEIQPTAGDNTANKVPKSNDTCSPKKTSSNTRRVSSSSRRRPMKRMNSVNNVQNVPSVSKNKVVASDSAQSSILEPTDNTHIQQTTGETSSKSKVESSREEKVCFKVDDSSNKNSQTTNSNVKKVATEKQELKNKEVSNGSSLTSTPQATKLECTPKNISGNETYKVQTNNVQQEVKIQRDPKTVTSSHIETRAGSSEKREVTYKPKSPSQRPSSAKVQNTGNKNQSSATEPVSNINSPSKNDQISQMKFNETIKENIKTVAQVMVAQHLTATPKSKSPTRNKLINQVSPNRSMKETIRVISAPKLRTNFDRKSVEKAENINVPDVKKQLTSVRPSSEKPKHSTRIVTNVRSTGSETSKTIKDKLMENKTNNTSNNFIKTNKFLKVKSPSNIPTKCLSNAQETPETAVKAKGPENIMKHSDNENIDIGKVKKVEAPNTLILPTCVKLIDTNANHKPFPNQETTKRSEKPDDSKTFDISKKCVNSITSNNTTITKVPKQPEISAKIDISHPIGKSSVDASVTVAVAAVAESNVKREQQNKSNPPKGVAGESKVRQISKDLKKAGSANTIKSVTKITSSTKVKSNTNIKSCTKLVTSRNSDKNLSSKNKVNSGNLKAATELRPNTSGKNNTESSNLSSQRTSQPIINQPVFRKSTYDKLYSTLDESANQNIPVVKESPWAQRQYYRFQKDSNKPQLIKDIPEEDESPSKNEQKTNSDSNKAAKNVIPSGKSTIQNVLNTNNLKKMSRKQNLNNRKYTSCVNLRKREQVKSDLSSKTNFQRTVSSTIVPKLSQTHSRSIIPLNFESSKVHLQSNSGHNYALPFKSVLLPRHSKHESCGIDSNQPSQSFIARQHYKYSYKKSWLPFSSGSSLNISVTPIQELSPNPSETNLVRHRSSMTTNYVF